MIIRSNPKSNRLIMLGGLTVTLVGLKILIESNYLDTRADPLWIIATLTVMGIYIIVLAVSELYFSFFKSPKWIELRNNLLIIKMPFQESYSVEVASVERVCKKKFYQVSGTYDVKMFIPDRKLMLYFGKSSFDNLDEFLRELKKANPNCEIDEFLM